MKEKINRKRPKGMPRWEWREQLEKEFPDEYFPEEEYAPAPYYETPKENMIKRILKGAGIGGLVISGGILFAIFGVLQFLFTAVAGIGMIWWAVILFSEGSIILGLLVLLIGTPIAIGLAHWAFFFFLILGILSGIIWGIASLFGLDVSFGNAWDIIWLIIGVLILGFLAYIGISGLIEAIKVKAIGSFLKENWFYILLFFLLLWLFFL